MLFRSSDPAAPDGDQPEVEAIAVDSSPQSRGTGVFQERGQLFEFNELAIAFKQAGEQIGRLGHFCCRIQLFAPNVHQNDMK